MRDRENYIQTYDGDDTPEAIEMYGSLRYQAENLLDVLDELEPHDRAIASENAAIGLLRAESIRYRFQGIQRHPIVDDAIFIEEVEHLEHNFTMGGSSVSFRRDWLDREESRVRDFLRNKYPRIEKQIDEAELWGE